MACAPAERQYIRDDQEEETVTERPRCWAVNFRSKCLAKGGELLLLLLPWCFGI
jgi:hypothetical protein